TARRTLPRRRGCGERWRMPRSWIWLQLLLGWLPVGALFALMFIVAHGGSLAEALAIATQMMLTAALLGIVVYPFAVRVPWPHRLHARFIATQIGAAAAYAFTWFALNAVIASSIGSAVLRVRGGRLALALVVGPGWGVLYVIMGIWLYVMVAGIAYANRAAEHAARVEALAARTQL